MEDGGPNQETQEETHVPAGEVVHWHPHPCGSAVKNPPAVRETWVQPLGWEDPLEKGKATHSSILACIVHGIAKSWTRLRDFHFHTCILTLS